MRRDGAMLLGKGAGQFRDGSAHFFHKGTNERWRGIFRDDDLALYDAKMATLPEDCARWIAGGRAAVDPGAQDGGAAVSRGGRKAQRTG